MARIILILYVLTTSLALIFLKMGTNSGALISFSGGKLGFNFQVLSLLGIFLYGTSFLLYTYLIAKFDLGYIIPFATAFVYVAIFIASYFIFKEAFTAVKILGIGLILGGIVLLNIGK